MIAASRAQPAASAAKAAMLAGLVYAGLLGAIHLLTPPSPDSAIFDYMGWRVLAGDRLYVDVIEQNWPGAVWIHMVSTALFGNTWWSFRLLDCLLMLQASAALFWMGNRSGLRGTGWIAAALYPLMYLTSSPWITGQRDALVGHLLVAGSVLYLANRGQWRGPGMVVFGLLCALVVMVRPTYLLFPALVVLLELGVHLYGSRPLRPFLIGVGQAAAAFVVSLALVAALGFRSGGLAGWWEAAIQYNLSVYSGSAGLSIYLDAMVWLFQSWHWYLVFGAIGAVLWWRTGDPWVWLLVMALALTCLVSFVVQGKGFGYHLAGVLPVLALFAGHTIAWSAGVIRARRSWPWVLVAVVLVVVALAGTARKLRAVSSQALVLAGVQTMQAHLEKSEFGFEGIDMADLVRVADHIRAHTGPDETVLVWNRGIWINYLAERKMPVPFATVGALAQFKDPPTGLARRWLAAFQQGLDCAPPAYIVLGSQRGWSDETLGDAGSAPAMPASDRALREALRQGYRLETRIGGAELWRRSSPPPQPCPGPAP
jgi:hypothetical protein